MKKLNKKGFTLVELLVAITILGIIMVIALPQLTGLQNDNANTKYEKYSDSVVTSAKLYTDSYAKDMFGNNTSGCYDIPYKKLEEKNLAKDIRIDDLTCDTYNDTTPTTFVRVYKSQDIYLYDIAIKCVDKNNKVVYEKNLNGDICNGKSSDESGPTIEISGIENGWTTGRDSSGNPLKATVTIEDPYGLKENIKFLYVWTQDISNLDSLTYKTHSFTNSREEAIRTLSFDIEYPQNENGLWYLVIKPGPDGIRDLNGNYHLETHTVSPVVKLDNTPPVITNLVNSKDGVWTNQPVTISGIINDGHSGVKKIYYSYSSNGSNMKEFGTSQITSGGLGPFNVSNTWSTNTNESIYVIGEDSVGNKTVVMPIGKIMLDVVKPTLVWVTTPGRYDNNDGITVTSKCTDDLSGVKTSSSGTKVSSPTSSSGTNITHSCTDKAGNPASITDNFKVRYNSRVKSCGVESYKSCEHSSCGVKTYKYCKNAACGNATCATSGCGVALYKSCRHVNCGTQCGTCLDERGQSTTSCVLCPDYVKTCRNYACGVESYNTCKHSQCGYASCRTSGCGVDEYKSCVHEDCGVSQYKKCWHY